MKEDKNSETRFLETRICESLILESEELWGKHVYTALPEEPRQKYCLQHTIIAERYKPKIEEARMKLRQRLNYIDGSTE